MNTALSVKEEEMSNNENKPKTLREGLNRLRDPGRSLFLEDLAKNLADVLEILIVMGFDTDGRSLDIDVTNFRPTEPKEGDRT